MDYVDAKHLSNIAMVSRNEEHYSIVIDKGVVKQWVGFGWIDLREATTTDKKTYPTVKRK